MYMVNSINSHNYTVYRPAGKLDSVRFANTTDCSLVMGWVTVGPTLKTEFHGLRFSTLTTAPGRGDIPAPSPAEAGTRYGDPGGTRG